MMTSTFETLPENVKLRILRKLDSKSLLRCRAVSKNFFPDSRDLGVEVILLGSSPFTSFTDAGGHRTKATYVRVASFLNLSPNVEQVPRTTETIDVTGVAENGGDAIHVQCNYNSYRPKFRITVFETLASVPTYILAKTVMLIITGEGNEGSRVELDLITRACTSIRYFACIGTGQALWEGIKPILTSNKGQLLSIAAMFNPLHTRSREDNLTLFDMKDLATHTTNLKAMTMVSEKFAHFNQIPRTLTHLTMTWVTTKQLMWISKHLLKMDQLSLTVKEEKGRKLEVETFKGLCDLPVISFFQLMFTPSQENGDAEELHERLQGILNMCQGLSGIEVKLETEDEQVFGRFRILLKVTIQRSKYLPFRPVLGSKVKPDGDEIDDLFRAVDKCRDKH